MHEKTGPWNAVFFTGDLVQKGLVEEFQRLDDLLDSLWSELKQLGSAPFLLAVPGNHDLTRPDAKKAAVRVLTKWGENTDIQDEFWTDPGSEYRAVVEGAFANYADWWKRCELKAPITPETGLLPGEFSATVEHSGLTIGVVGLNTTFLQLTTGNFEKLLAWDQRQFHAACRGDGPAWAKEHQLCMLLTHHPLSWLDEISQKAGAEIAPAGRFVLHMFGHKHELDIRSEAQAGGPLRRLWQGKSLFGLEKYGDLPGLERRHGYSVGSISFDGNTANFRLWP